MISEKEIQRIKQRFGIIGNYDRLNRAIETAVQIAKTDVSVLVTGESGVGKEVFPQIIHQNSIRKHGPYIAVNCGAIPEGTIDSELFGHKKGSFTDAVSERKGYFEVADGGTIFLDEIGELPMPTQARLLRVLESGEFMKVGSSEVQKTDIRVVAATNVDLLRAIKLKKFRQDLFYRLNTVTIELPPLRERGDDITLLFRKFASDFADKYRMPPIRLNEDAERTVMMYSWPGNIRELRNLVERISVVEEERNITREVLLSHLPSHALSRLPSVVEPKVGGERPFNSFGGGQQSTSQIHNDLVYKMLVDLKLEVNNLSQYIRNMHTDATDRGSYTHPHSTMEASHSSTVFPSMAPGLPASAAYGSIRNHSDADDEQEYEEVEPTLSLDEMEREYILKVLEKNGGNRKKSANDLKISERTLYRKLKDHEID